jgi:hypothetical protein
MSFTADNQFELIASGQADWDTSLNSNFAIAERGHHVTFQAGSAINSGDTLSMTNSGTVVRYNPGSRDAKCEFISPFAVTSGSNGMFVALGSIRSMTVWSGAILAGRPVYGSINSPGFLVSSFAGHKEQLGIATAVNAVRFDPNRPTFPYQVTETRTVGPIVVGSEGNFEVPIGDRAIVREVTITSSHNRFKVQFWTNSNRSSSTLEYETLTRSWSPSSADVTSTYFTDQALFPHKGTDVGCPWLMHGKITAQSGTGVTSAYALVTIIAERFA